MIKAVHNLIYSDDPVATRAFFKDVLGFPYVVDHTSGEESSADDPHSWLIFATGPSETGVHPTMTEFEGETFEAPTHHQISFIVDDIEAAVATLRERGATVKDPTNMGFGIGVEVPVPGTDAVLIYQPRHVTTVAG